MEHAGARSGYDDIAIRSAAVGVYKRAESFGGGGAT